MDKIFKTSVFIAIISFIYSCNTTDGAYVNLNDKNELERPLDYRSWIFAGTSTTPAELNPGMDGFSDFQNIYIDPISFEFWKNKGYFREGTIIVKEIIAASEETNLPIGKTYLQAQVLRLSAMIKDTTRFPDAPGGWEYFSYTNEDGTFKKYSNPIGNKGCIACHKLTNEGSGPFVEHHMILREARGFGNGNPENLDDRSILPSHNIKLLRDLK